MLSQYLRETPDFVKGIVEWGRGDADDVGFAKITFHVGGLELAEQFFWMLVCQNRQLATALIRIVWRDDGKFFRSNFR